MKPYREWKYSSTILNLHTIWRWVVSPCLVNPVPILQVAGWAPEPIWTLLGTVLKWLLGPSGTLFGWIELASEWILRVSVPPAKIPRAVFIMHYNMKLVKPTLLICFLKWLLNLNFANRRVRHCDKVLPGQGYCTWRGVEQWWNDAGRGKTDETKREDFSSATSSTTSSILEHQGLQPRLHSEPPELCHDHRLLLS
jgi:hypothetical protein